MYDFYAEIKKRESFQNRTAWAVCTMYHGICIGIWNGNNLIFHKSAGYKPGLVTEMRVFNTYAELRFFKVGNVLKTRYINDDYETRNLADTYESKYLMLGTADDKHEKDENGIEWTYLTEKRGRLWFPKNITEIKGSFALWLGIINYLKYNEVPITDADLKKNTGKPVMETIDYRYTGFWQGLNKLGTAVEEVKL